MAQLDDDLLARGVARGIITEAQREALRALGDAAGTSRREGRSGFTGVNVAYGLGALLVVFASAWFLVSRWEALGPPGVLLVAGGYAAILTIGGRQVERRGFPRAGQLLQALAVVLTPVVTWGVLRLTGVWSDADWSDPLWRYPPFNAARMLVLSLSTVLVVLLAWRRRRFPLLTVPLAVALWWGWFHLGQLLGADRTREWYDLSVMLAAGLAMLATADGVERWQRRTGVVMQEGDYAGPLWIVGVIAFSLAFVATWSELDRGRHVLVPVALGLIAMSLRTRRRAPLVGGVAGVFGYLAWLAGDVFKDGAAFPVVLAGLGVALIVTTVWLQKRFPTLATRVGGEDGLPLPWPVAASWVPALVAAAMAAVIAVRDGPDPVQVRFERNLREMQRQNRSSDRAARPPRPDSTAPHH